MLTMSGFSSHSPVVEIGVGDAKTVSEALHPLGPPVCHRDYFRLVNGPVGPKMAVGFGEVARSNFILDQTAHAARANNGDAIIFGHFSFPRCGTICGLDMLFRRGRRRANGFPGAG